MNYGVKVSPGCEFFFPPLALMLYSSADLLYWRFVSELSGAGVDGSLVTKENICRNIRNKDSQRKPTTCTSATITSFFNVIIILCESKILNGLMSCVGNTDVTDVSHDAFRCTCGTAHVYS